MNILMYGSSYPPTRYGASRYFENLAHALASRGHGVAVVTHQEPGLPETTEEGGVRIHRICPKGQLSSKAAAGLALKIAGQAGVDLIQGVEYLGECAAILRVRDRPPVCIKAISSISMRVLRRSLGYGFSQRILVEIAALRAWRQWFNERRCLQQADIVFGATQRVLDELVRQGIRLPTTCGVVPNPVGEPVGQPYGESAEPSLLFVGRLDFGKGVASLPLILREVKKVFPGVRLVLAGGDLQARGIGSMREWLWRRFGEDAGNVEFTGILDYAALDRQYRRAWVVLVPSRWDSCSNVTLEAMARARPVVVSPHGGMPELVDGCGAVVADPSDPTFAGAVISLLRDAGLRDAAGGRLLIRARQCYSPERVVERYEQFVSAALGQA